jgi:HSP20 family protein
LVIKAERRDQRQLTLTEPVAEAGAQVAPTPAAKTAASKSPLMSEFRYGIWSRSFRFPQAIAHDKLEARYHGGLLTVTAPKAQNASTVTVRVEG